MVEILTLTSINPITDFALERNKLLDQSKSEPARNASHSDAGGWVLFLDNDEKISPKLQKELNENNFNKDGYFIKRVDFFMGKWLRFGETGNIKLLRLGRCGLPAGRQGKWVRKVHEYWDIKNTGELSGTILHYPSLTILKINQYSDIDANEFGPLKYWELLKPVFKFIQNYFIKLGFLDGTAGFVHAFMMSFQSLTVRVKQYEKIINTSNCC